LKELRALRESSSEFDDEYFSLSLLLVMNKLSPEANVMLRIKTNQNLMQIYYQ
jgi:hypothetical protein